MNLLTGGKNRFAAAKVVFEKDFWRKIAFRRLQAK
jgi:hypothetical protein